MRSEHVRSYAAAIAQARRQGPDAFQAWFDDSGSVGESLVRGYWDFALHVLTPAVCARLARPHEATALEIGYGGGRLLNAACGFFREAIGVDVHDEEAAVRELLEAAGRTNFRLIRGTGNSLDVPSASIDLVYSFIVLQHLPSFAFFRAYLHETARCLKPGGLGQLYFGRWSTLPLAGRLRFLRSGYRELSGLPVNQVSLVVQTGTVKRLARGVGLGVVDAGRSFKRVPDGYPDRPGGQSFVTLVKAGS